MLRSDKVWGEVHVIKRLFPIIAVRSESNLVHQTNDSTILRFCNIEDVSHITLSLGPHVMEIVLDISGDIQLTIRIETETSEMLHLNSPRNNILNLVRVEILRPNDTSRVRPCSYQFESEPRMVGPRNQHRITLETF